MTENPRNIAKNRKTRVLHSGYIYEGKLLKNHIDKDIITNPHTNFIVKKIDLILTKISKSVEYLENFFDVAKEKQ